MGRPRKYPKIVIENKNGGITQTSNDGTDVVSEPKVKKKRGRKPKIRTPEELALLSQVGKKKRGRKPKEKFNFNANNMNTETNLNEPESIIVRLSISPEDIKNLENNNKQPKPFDPNDNLQYNSNNLGYYTINKKNKKKNDNKLEINIIKSNKNKTELETDNTDKDETDKTETYESHKTETDKTESYESHKTETDKTESETDKTVSETDKTDIKYMNNTYDNNTLQSQRNNLLNISKHNIIQNIKSEINTDMFNETFIKNTLYNDKLDNRQISLLLKNKFEKENKINILIQLAHCNKMEKWPEKTNICCIWCCHEFDNTPWGIPYKYEDGLFHLFGIFCSPNCAASYIFNNLSYSNNKWEYFSLLNLLYYKIYNTIKEIYLAPSKLSLKKFGGCMEIDEYRDKLDKDNIYLLKFPPSISIIPVIEEINENKYNIKNMNKSNNFIPLDTNRIKKANKELKLKRSKPLTNSKNTLDSCMNINIIST